MKSSTQVVQNLLKPYIDNKDKAYAANIAPVETSPATAAHTAGTQIIYEGVLYDVTVDISVNDPLATTGAGANISAADNITSQIQTLTQKAYLTDDATETSLANNDLLPFYDTSATAKKKMAISDFVGAIVCNRNLLDNPYFTINQRGATLMTGGYGVDRWMGKGTVTSNGIQMVAADYLIQDIEQSIKDFANGKILTVSIQLADGTYYIGTAIYHNDADTVWVNNTDINISSGSFDNYAFSFTAKKSMTIKRVKLEFSEFSTIVNDTPPDYQQELAKCQRYFYRLANSIPYGFVVGYGGVYNDENVRISIPLPVSMRTLPTIACGDLTKLECRSGSLALAVFGLSNSVLIGGTQMGITAILPSYSELTIGDEVRLSMADTYIDFSADL